MKPRMTDKVKQGLAVIVARSATLWSAELGGPGMDRDEREAVLAAGRYAQAHWMDSTTEDMDRAGVPRSASGAA